MAKTEPRGGQIKDATLTDADMAAANKDGVAGTASMRTLGSGAQQAKAGNAAPVAHASAHASGGGDPIKLDDLAAPDDNTDLDASTSKHGLLKKLPGGVVDVLHADGSFAPVDGTKNIYGAGL